MATPNTQIFLLFVFAILLPRTKSQPFDDFWFVQQWPPNVCALQSGRCIGRGTNSFTIHGLWPQKGGNSVTNCPGTSFDFNQISHLENDLNIVWPNLITGNHKWFWGHEWNTHGICSESKYDEKAYFQTSINLRHNINLLSALRVQGVVPNGASKSKQRVESAIISHFKKNPVLRCKTASNGQVLLTEIVMCIDDDGVTLINCNLAKSNCANSFIF
ncbi:ribonuclease MC-like [Cucurbita pepo subsp. pepo]|uniref:ribonuclease MC-like n=1 Tax=Cucurbita pepo subsp. pepo TaxID=3664 RepID=UPI000C9D82D6|nr:ribonuclease MC-like [Cucurbita pepo subsp. pepo]